MISHRVFFEPLVTVAADVDYYDEMDIRSCKKLKVIVSAAGADASDLIDLQITAVVGG